MTHPQQNEKSHGRPNKLKTALKLCQWHTKKWLRPHKLTIVDQLVVVDHC